VYQGPLTFQVRTARFHEALTALALALQWRAV